MLVFAINITYNKKVWIWALPKISSEHEQTVYDWLMCSFILSPKCFAAISTAFAGWQWSFNLLSTYILDFGQSGNITWRGASVAAYGTSAWRGTLAARGDMALRVLRRPVALSRSRNALAARSSVAWSVTRRIRLPKNLHPSLSFPYSLYNNLHTKNSWLTLLFCNRANKKLN